MKNMKYKTWFLLILTTGLYGSCCGGGLSVMFLTPTCYEGLKYALFIGLFCPSIVIADLVFFLLMKRYNKYSIGLWAFTIPFIVPIFIFDYLHNGNLSIQELPPNDYRFFRDTPAFPLVRQITKDEAIGLYDQEILDCRDANGDMTPLIFCIRNSHYDKAVDLLSMGADANKLDGQTRMSSPLWSLCASYYDNYSATKRILLESLLDHGADTNYNCDGKTPLMLLTTYAEAEVKDIELLLKYGADVKYKDYYQNSVAHLNALNQSIDIGRYDIALLLIEQGADTIGCRDWMLEKISNNNKQLKNNNSEYKERLYDYLIGK